MRILISMAAFTLLLLGSLSPAAAQSTRNKQPAKSQKTGERPTPSTKITISNVTQMEPSRKSLLQDTYLHLLLIGLTGEALQSPNISAGKALELAERLYAAQSLYALDPDLREYLRLRSDYTREVGRRFKKLEAEARGSETLRSFVNGLNQFSDARGDFGADFVNDLLDANDASIFIEYDKDLDHLKETFDPVMTKALSAVGSHYGFTSGANPDKAILEAAGTLKVFNPVEAEKRRQVLRAEYLASVTATDAATWEYFGDGEYDRRKRLLQQLTPPGLFDFFGETASLVGEAPLKLGPTVAIQVVGQSLKFTAQTLRTRRLAEAKKVKRDTERMEKILEDEIRRLQSFQELAAANVEELAQAGTFTPRFNPLSLLGLDISPNTKQQGAALRDFVGLHIPSVLSDRQSFLAYVRREGALLDEAIAGLEASLSDAPNALDIPPEQRQPSPPRPKTIKRPPIIRRP